MLLARRLKILSCNNLIFLKIKALVKIFLVGGLAFTLASCGSSNPYYGNRYPDTSYPNGGVYRAPDGSVYRQGDVYRDTNGNVYQNGRILRRGVYGQPGVLSRNGNVYGNQRQLPPGQAKKIYGGKATDYAKGQQKKRGGYYGNDRNWRNDDDRYENGRYQKGQNKNWNKNKGKRKNK